MKNYTLQAMWSNASKSKHYGQYDSHVFLPVSLSDNPHFPNFLLHSSSEISLYLTLVSICFSSSHDVSRSVHLS